MNTYIKPQSIRVGDKAIIVSPSGCIDTKYINGAKSILENWGLTVEMAPHADCQCGRFGGTVTERLHDLQNAMNDNSVRLIFCSRGGYGAIHLLESLDFSAIKQQPKWLVGFSDITALHLAFMQNGLQSLHAPMARHLTEYSSDKASLLLKQTLFEGKQTNSLISHPLNKKGQVTGHLFGGNLAVLSALIGTPYMNLPSNPILFIEDIGEAPYKIDRMMWQLKLSGILSQLSGLVVGQFTDYSEDPLMYASVYQSIYDLIKGYNYPVVFNYPVGHVEANYPMLNGALATLSIDNERVIIEF